MFSLICDIFIKDLGHQKGKIEQYYFLHFIVLEPLQNMLISFFGVHVIFAKKHWLVKKII
jgi:hypothetical protein